MRQVLTIYIDVFVYSLNCSADFEAFDYNASLFDDVAETHPEFKPLPAKFRVDVKTMGNPWIYKEDELVDS